MFALLEKQTANLKKYHPKAQMWMSPQAFHGAWLDEFHQIMSARPAWLSGVVHGPQVDDSPAELRALIGRDYGIRLYPDITHSHSAQYPVPDWDRALYATLWREPINPRPTDPLPFSLSTEGPLKIDGPASD